MEKTFDKIQYPFIIKALNKLGTYSHILILINGIYKHPQLASHIMVQDWMLFI